MTELSGRGKVISRVLVLVCATVPDVDRPVIVSGAVFDSVGCIVIGVPL